MKLVRSTLRNRVKNRAAISPVFCIKLVGDQPYFLNEVGIVQLNRCARYASIVVILTVNHEIIRPQSTAICGVTDALRELRLIRLNLTNTGGRQRHIENAAISSKREF